MVRPRRGGGPGLSRCHKDGHRAGPDVVPPRGNPGPTRSLARSQRGVRRSRAASAREPRVPGQPRARPRAGPAVGRGRPCPPADGPAAPARRRGVRPPGRRAPEDEAEPRGDPRSPLGRAPSAFPFHEALLPGRSAPGRVRLERGQERLARRVPGRSRERVARARWARAEARSTVIRARPLGPGRFAAKRGAPPVAGPRGSRATRPSPPCSLERSGPGRSSTSTARRAPSRSGTAIGPRSCTWRPRATRERETRRAATGAKRP